MRKRIDWQTVISGYDPDQETIKEYCARLHVSSSAYYTKRKELRQSQILPVRIENPDQTAIEINHVPIRYSDSLSDEELKRVIRLCKDL